MTDLLDRARGALHAQPFSMLLGAELMHTGTQRTDAVSADPRRTAATTWLRARRRDQLSGRQCADLRRRARARAAGRDHGEYKINYLRPAVNGTLVARAKVVYAGRHQATCQCNVM